MGNEHDAKFQRLRKDPRTKRRRKVAGNQCQPTARCVSARSTATSSSSTLEDSGEIQGVETLSASYIKLEKNIASPGFKIDDENKNG